MVDNSFTILFTKLATFIDSKYFTWQLDTIVLVILNEVSALSNFSNEYVYELMPILPTPSVVTVVPQVPVMVDATKFADIFLLVIILDS